MLLRNRGNILGLVLLIILNVCACVCAHAQTDADTIRYVRPNGAYENDGRSWENAKNKVQDAINDLKDYLKTHNLTSGSVYIAAGTYVPTESTESTGGSMLNTSFKIYSGIHVYGGFNPDTPESKPEDRIMGNGKKQRENWSDPSGIGTTSGEDIASQWDFRYKTILSGNHSTTPPTFTFDSIRGRFNTAYPASSFHVVWFATNGKYEGAGVNDSTAGHYCPLEHPASVDGCVISSGNAATKSTTLREHTAYGGGVYMVGNSYLRNCIVERCNATMRGGGIYADGGGVIEFCYVQTCQATGVGVYEGYGGGVCIDQDGSIGHSHITNCAARCGGGLMIAHIPGEYPWEKRGSEPSQYAPFTTACVVNNNTASAEGGGIYLANGGTVNHATVCGNNCVGLDVTYYGRRHGRSGGIYVRNCGMIFNSVFWGNRCDVNNDIQFASVRQKTAPGYETFVYHSAFMNHDITDWTGVKKEEVFTLEKTNMPVASSHGNHPCFFNPTVNPNNWEEHDHATGVYGAGVFRHLRPVDIPGPRVWHLTSYSAIDQKGVQVSEAVQNVSEWLRHAHTDYGVVSNPYEPSSTLGALVRRPDSLTYALIKPQGLEGRLSEDPIPTLFIDPNRKGVFDSDGKFVPQSKEGNSWDVPTRDLGQALSYFRQYMVDNVGDHHYMIPQLDANGMPTGEPKRYEFVQILVKEGTLTTVGPGNYINRDIRTAATRVESHMRLYGGYPASLTGTDTGKRDPHAYVSRITANITGTGGTSGFANNSAHVIAMVNAEKSIVDGFTLSDGNAHNIQTTVTPAAGGGLLISNQTIPKEKRIHMTGNQLRNSVITNCTAPKGAAVYVNGEWDGSDNDMICYAELKMVNCVIRNNTADYEDNEHHIDDHGIVTANGRAFIDMEHCDIVNNVGYPLKADNKQTLDNTQLVICHSPLAAGRVLHGYIRVNNSIIFCNGDQPLDNRGDLGSTVKVMSVFPDGQRYVFGEYNLFDKDLRLQVDSADKVCPRGFFDPDFKMVPVPDGYVPHDEAFGSALLVAPPAEKNNKAILTRTDINDVNYPGFVNPSRNVGASATGDKPLYGGKVSYVPITTNPCVNAGYKNGYSDEENYDRSDNIVRTRGGAPDIGALENTDLPAAGAVIYVTPEGAGKRDGSSWSNAIAGNTVYMVNGIVGPGLAEGDRIDPEATCNRLLDSEGNPILTTNSKYNGGWGRAWFTNKNSQTTTTQTTHAYITGTNTYTGGGPNDHSEPVTPYWETSSETTPDGSTPEPWVAGSAYNPLYPYGEISGASRSFWRANIYHSDTTEWNNGNGYSQAQFITACNDNGWINNTRAEKYVSGLQWAVEEAARRNHVATRIPGEAYDTLVQVWVGAGKYTDYKGYFMRDSVSVYGGFPVGKYTTPGMNERHALMSNVVSIPKAADAESFNPADYECILQISDINPKANNDSLDEAAIKYWDDDYSLNEIHDTETIDTVNIARTATYTWKKDTNYVTATYIRYADMLNGSTNVWSQRHKDMSGGTGKVDNYTEPAECGGVDFSEVNPAGYVYQYFGDSWQSKPEGNHGWELVYGNGYDKANVNYDSFRFDDTKNVVNESGTNIDTDTKGMCLSGYMKDMSAWQTMKEVPAGSYWLQIDLGAYYTGDPNNTETCVTFYILASNGDTVAEQPVYCKDNKLRRYEFSFDQPADGDLTVRVMATPGARNTTPTSTDNNRKVYMDNVLLGKLEGTAYVLTNQEDDTTIVSTSGPQESTSFDLTVQRHRTSLRKRVLSMPDVCVPTYGAGSVGDPTDKNRGAYADGLAHTHRVKGPSKAKRSSWENTGYVKEDPNYIEYQEASWDGFTIRHGFIANENMAHGGGAGVNLYEGAHLRNSIVINNMSACDRVKGGGIYSDGATATIEGCFVLNNTSTHGKKNAEDKKSQGQIFAAGLFMYEGTSFNSLFANNYSSGSSGGVGFCVGKFYNNTIAYNTANLVETKISGGAISLATSSSPNLFVANTIIFGNNGIAIRDRATDYKNVNPYLHCYVQSAEGQPNDATNRNVGNFGTTTSGKANYGINNIYLNGVAPSAENTPFAADFDEEGNYEAGRAASLNDFRLRDGIGCVNHGTEEFAGEFYTALIHKGKKDADIRNSFVYQSVEAAQLPDNDVAFADRVQDCQVDIGAYEFDDTKDIRPDTTTHPGQAIFYITFDSPGGDASGRSPDNAACRQKLQKVLDAAGRYKYALMTQPRYTSVPAKPVAGDPDSTWTVEVWLEGDNTNSTTSDSYSAWYTPTRSTKNGQIGYHDNTLDYSFIVPHGVQVKGGYTSQFYHYEDAAGNEVDAGTSGAVVVDERDPLTYRTVLSGKITSNTGAEGQTYHVVTFTNDLFDLNQNLYREETGERLPITNQLAVLKEAKDRAVLDGLFIEDGYANASDDEGRIGGAAVVTDYAHVRNCVIRNNTAMGEGGALYLKPFALISGCIIRDNTANIGGGIYVEAPEKPNNDSLAYIYASTICANTATASAGGMWFDNTYVRVNSTALWHNEANDNANVAGSFSRSSTETDYPFKFCAVESRRLEGQANLELSPSETEGVRWDRGDPFLKNNIQYYPIEMSSTLSRAGMTYRDWKLALAAFPTLDTIDIAGVSRLSWKGTNVERGFAWTTDTLVTKKNDFIEIGARAINKNYAINVDENYVMRRLYVMHTDLLNSEAARKLQDNIGTTDADNMYRQMGSCILNPFHRLGDAFDYVIAARKENPAKYRGMVFEIYIEQGTYYPYHNAYGEQDEVRNNTFLVPEAIYVIGGIDSRPESHWYGQEGFYDEFSGESYGNSTENVTVAGYEIKAASRDEIRIRDKNHRPMRDNNLNSVIEPWELERQTILSGNTVSGEDFTHVYHVVTMTADSTKVGPQPFKYRHATHDGNRMIMSGPISFDDHDHFHEECDFSILARTTEFDGIQITGGCANHIDAPDTVAHHYATKTYFQGGGILVDGNWTESFDSPEDTEVPVVTAPAKYDIPIIVENCVFTDNMAGNGGAIYSNGGIYLYGCHFTQNYSQGPMTKLDQKYIPWTAGGCIATNATCYISNTLFDNNEARRGLYPVTAVSPKEKIADADARQGFGGVLSVGSQAMLRAINCHFMKNKAVAYPSIYNFLANNHYSNPDSMQYAFNCLFWGNEVFEVNNIGELENVEPPTQTEIEAFNNKYKNSRAGVFHYDGKIWDRYEKYYHEYDSLFHYWTTVEPDLQKRDTFKAETIAKLMQLRAVGDSLEGLYFCSYRTGYGPTGMRPTKDGYLLTREEQRAFVDPRKKAVKLELHNGTPVESYDSLFSYLHGNNNVIINRINTATDGPNFRQPSFVAGIDGYMQNADWLQARMNITTDQGWGALSQNVVRGVGYYITTYTGKTHYDTEEEAKAAVRAINPSISDQALKEAVIPVSGVPVASFRDTQDTPGAIYNWFAKRYGTYTSQVNPPLPLGNQQYMTYTRSNSDSETSGVMNRISLNPRMKIEDIFIDMGIYEYQYVQLDMEGQEIDTMWVATKEKGSVRDGLHWETPTTDLQYAIDMLMSSRNNHDKYVCFLGDEEGVFSPNNVLNNRRTFLISSNSLEPLLPDSAEADKDYGVKSLTFLGGYSFDVKDKPRDPVAHPTVLEMPNIGTANQRNQLFVIEDMSRQWEQANWTGQVTTSDKFVIPITFDGLTFINPYSTRAKGDGEGLLSNNGGAAIYYRWQRQYEKSSGTTFTPIMDSVLYADTIHLGEKVVSLPKLTITNCTFMDNGDWSVPAAQRSPAIRIDHGGGSSLIVNSLFHSNAGAPIYARLENIPKSAPNAVTIINSTFALNGGHITLEAPGNQIHNSLIWLDDLANDTTTMLQFGPDPDATRWGRASDEDKNRTGITDSVTHNAFWGCFRAGDTDLHNDSLSTVNNSVSEGPGFVNPFTSATSSGQRRDRSFRLNPSMKTSGQADQGIYSSRVLFRYPAAERPALTSEYDLAHKPRLSGPGLERGAFECLAQIQRVLYVRPAVAEAMAGDGSHWTRPFGQGQLQNAIDAAAVYTYLNQDAEKRESRKAYVFVQGDPQSLGPIEARDGVFVYGSLPSNFTDTAKASLIEGSENQYEYTDAECQRFVNYVRAYESGVATSATPSSVTSVRIEGDPFETGFLLDGFMITNTANAHSTPVIIDNDLSAVRNCLIVNNKVDAMPLVEVRKGLLYNSLIYGDSASTLVRVGANGLALNNTIVSDIESVAPIDTTEAVPGAVRNNIALNSKLVSPDCFAPYFTEQTPYTLPDYLLENKALGYQLHEHSAYIHAGIDDASLGAVYAPYVGDSTIAFRYDRDVLGNPRKIGPAVDMGALETWRVEPNTVREITARTNKVLGSDEVGDMYKLYAYLENYGGNSYPHQGSVVYLMDSSAMSMQYQNLPDFVDIKSSTPFTFRPGYMLLKSGASFYGNGHNVQLAYVAAEKRFVNQRYSMTAWPFDYDITNITNAQSPMTGYQSPITWYQYNGEARSAKDYVFQTDNSALWTKVDAVNRTATEGYLMDFGSVMTDTTLRFTSFAPSVGQYVYTENENDKYVFLTQYDWRIAGTGNDLNFTRQEDMGWNMKGLPWLVSNYRTDTILEEGNYLRQMYIPHVFYQMDGAGNYLTSGDQMYTSRSWDKGATMAMGNAFFTQTATTKDKETLVFHLPYYDRNEKASRPILRMVSRPATPTPSPMPAHAPVSTSLEGRSGGVSVLSDFLTAIPDAAARKDVRYNYGRDGIKWSTNTATPQLYMMDAARTSRISLLGAAPTEVDIPLGVYIPQNDQMVNGQMVLDFSLPEKEAFAGYEYVWLIDYRLNRFTNLQEEDYTVELDPGETNDRFALRIGGFPKTDKDGARQYVVYSYEGSLFVRGLVAGDRITVYSASGKLIHQAVASGYEYTTPLTYQNGYIVKVNDRAHKVLNLAR